MFGSLLLVLSVVGAEPVEATSLATCVRPVAKLVAPKVDYVAGATRSTDCRQIALWLRQWEQTARHRPALSLARRDVLRHRVEARANAHAATAVEQLAGRIEITKLREAFIWTITDRDAGRVCLEATPRDETEQLFYGSIRVWLDESDGALNQLQVVSRSGETRFAWKNDFTPEPSPIRLVSATDDSPALIVGDELPSPLAPIPTTNALTEDHGCSSASETSPEASTSGVEPREQAGKLWAWLFGPRVPGIETPDPTDLSPVTPELEAILSQWEAASRDRKAVNVDFTRIVYNSLFEIEKRSKGQLAYQAPQSMTVVFLGDKPARGEVSRRIGKDGKLYRIEADRPETWIWTDREIVHANDEDKTYELTVLPPSQGPNRHGKPSSWLHSNLHHHAPFVFDINAEQLRLEWSLTLTSQTNGVAVIEATPRTAELKFRHSRCLVKLATQDWHPTAVKYIEPRGILETVILIQDWRTNPARPNGWNLRPGFNNFKARGYKLIAPP